jgi:hypothetical protein
VLQEIFPGVKVKLDIYHWASAVVLADPYSEDAHMFICMLSRAVLQVAQTKFSTKADKLREENGGVQPTKKQILKECHTVCPPKEALEANLLSLLGYFIA